MGDSSFINRNKLDEAQILLSSSQCKSKWRHLINVLLSENKEKRIMICQKK